MFNFECWILNFGWGSEAEVAERKAGHRLKRSGEDVFAAAAKGFLNFILAVYLLLSVAD